MVGRARRAAPLRKSQRRHVKKERRTPRLVRAALAAGMAAAAVDVGRVLDRGALSAAIIAVRVGGAGAIRMGALLSIFVRHFIGLLIQ